MRTGSDNAFHLTYCTNIHPGEDWATVASTLKQHLPMLKAQLAPETPFGVGLRLSNQAAHTLLSGDRLPQFRRWLDDEGLYVFTLNGFPYGSFHGEVVKDRVYAPDWRTRERVDYTIRLARILAQLAPDGTAGSISTSPLSYKPWLDGSATEEAFHTGSRHLAEVAVALAQIEDETGVHLHVDLEPEPDCLIENTAESIAFFEDWLWPVGGARLANALNVGEETAQSLLRRHIQLCYDTCHFAVEYETPAEAFAQFAAAGVPIGKVQLSAALRVPLPLAGRSAIAERLQPFAEATYLHQVVERRPDGSLHRYPDLPMPSRISTRRRARSGASTSTCPCSQKASTACNPRVALSRARSTCCVMIPQSAPIWRWRRTRGTCCRTDSRPTSQPRSGVN